MSENLDLVRSIFAEWERGEFRSVEWAHPELEYSTPEGLNPNPTTGQPEASTRWREFLEMWDDFRSVAEDFRELDGERVLVLLRFEGRGKGSGVSVTGTHAKGMCLFHVCDGKVTRLVLYGNRNSLADFALEK
jgi:hypothetical protein